MTTATPSSDLAKLTGVRSGKRSYYREFVRSDERMQRTVRALDSISRALVRTSQAPRTIMAQIASAAGEQLVGRWSLLVLHDGRLQWAQPRFVAVAADGSPCELGELPPQVRAELDAIRAGTAPGPVEQERWVRVPMRIEGTPVGSLAVLHGLDAEPEPGDLSLVRILANQAAVALRTAELYQSGLDLHRRAEQLYDEVVAGSRALASSTSQLRLTQQQLVAADQRALIDSERHRIARELHDSVTQLVLSAGMAVDLARLDSAELGQPTEHITVRLDQAKRLSQDAVAQLREAIYSLHHEERGEAPASLPELLEEMAATYRPRLQIRVRVAGEGLPADARVEQELARIAGEALFNVAAHADASRVEVRLVQSAHGIVLAVADDGRGEPKTLRRLLRMEHRSGEIAHRGLANMAVRADALGARLALRRSRLGGIEVRVTLAAPTAGPDHGPGPAVEEES